MASEMRVLVFASQKGGAGKTTLSGHVAVQAELADAGPVVLIDTDPQGSLATWWNVRETATPAFVKTEFSTLFQTIETLREAGFKLVVIDTPPAVTRAISEVVSYADLVVLPTRPSPHDLRAVGATVDIIEVRRKNMVFVINAATPKARITTEAAVALSEHGTVAPVTLHHRVDFAASMIDGRTVMETDPTGKSAQEVGALWEYLATRLEKVQRAPLEVPAAPAIRAPAFGQRAGAGAAPAGGFGQRAGAMPPPGAVAEAAPGPVAPNGGLPRPPGPFVPGARPTFGRRFGN